MSLRRILPLATLALTLALPSLRSQQILTLRGELDEGRSTGCYYCPNVPYTVKFSETPVRSSTVNLAFYKAQSSQLVLTGVWETSTTPPGLNVLSVQVTTNSLTFPTNARTGNTERFTTHAEVGAFAATVISIGSGFVPLFDTALLLNPAVLVVMDAGVTNAQGDFRIDFNMPSDPALIGARFWSQSVIVPPTGTPYTSNPGRTFIDR
ncbi:MAG: hypothetical protein U1F36_02570 [Planctomycetota bacterium]